MNVNNALGSINLLNTSVTHARMLLGALSSTYSNLSGNYWIMNSSLNTVSSALVSKIAFLSNVSSLADSISKTSWNTSSRSTVNVLSACLNNVSTAFWPATSLLDTVSLSLQTTTN